MPLWKQLLLTLYYHATYPVRAWNYWREVSQGPLAGDGALLSPRRRRSRQPVDHLERDVRAANGLAAGTVRFGFARRRPAADSPRLQPAAVRQHHLRRRLRRQLPAGDSVADQGADSLHLLRHGAERVERRSRFRTIW